MSMNEYKGVVSPTVLRGLVDAGAVNSAVIRLDESSQGLVGVAIVGDRQQLLGTSRGESIRYFTSIDGVVSAMQDCGIQEFKLEAEGFVSRGKKASALRGNGVRRAAQRKLAI